MSIHAGDWVGLLTAFFLGPPHVRTQGNMILIHVLEWSACTSFRGSPGLLPMLVLYAWRRGAFYSIGNFFVAGVPSASIQMPQEIRAS